MKNPYDTNLLPGSIPIKFLYEECGCYCFEVMLGRSSGMKAHMFGVEICEFIMNDAQGKVHYGNGFGKGHPPFTYDGTTSNNKMIAFSRKVDIALFARSFVITGADDILA